MLNIEKYQDEILKYAGYQHSLMCLIYENIMKKNDCTGCCSKCKRETIKWLTSECKEPILTEKEKSYLKNAIEPIREEIACVVKCYWASDDSGHAIYAVRVLRRNPIFGESDRVLLDFLTTEDMSFKNMELKRKYTIEELGL